MNLYLHIGLSKTGTTALQTFLWKYRVKLLENYKVLYPETGIHISKDSGAHYYLSWSIFAPISVKSKIKDIPIAKDLYCKLFNEIKEKKPEKIIISSEYFIHTDPILVRELIKDIKNINIIIYLRRQDLWIETNYSQGIKIGDFREIHFSEFKKAILQNSAYFYNYYNFLSTWQKAFPEFPLFLRIYDRKFFPEGDIILDFLSLLDLDIPDIKEYKTEANPSLSHLSALVMRKINERFNLTPEEHGKCIQYLFKLDREEGSPIKTFFTLPERIEFLEHFRESNEKLFRDWFNSENKFVLSDEEIEFYKEQDKISKGEIEKMVEDRYRKLLTYLMEQNAKPEVYFQNMKPKIVYYPNEKIEYMNVDVLQVDLLKGKMIIGGLVLLKEEINENFKLTSKVNGKEFEVKWGLPSPGLASKYQDNPYSKEARFQISGLEPNFENIEIMLNDVKIIEIKLSKTE